MIFLFISPLPSLAQSKAWAYFSLNQNAEAFSKEAFWNKNNEKCRKFCGQKPLTLFPPGRSFIYFWRCHAYRWSTPASTWLIAAYETKQESLHGILGTAARAWTVQGTSRTPFYTGGTTQRNESCRFSSPRGPAGPRSRRAILPQG